jgi:hypothetical protein
MLSRNWFKTSRNIWINLGNVTHVYLEFGEKLSRVVFNNSNSYLDIDKTDGERLNELLETDTAVRRNYNGL